MHQIESWILRGELGPARRRLRAMVAAGVPRARVAEVARLCRKAGLLDRCVALLRPFVLRERPGPAPSPLEVAEYAVALVNLGAVREGATKLAALDGREHPRVWLLRAFTLIRQWNWSDAIPLLDRYVACPSLSPRERLSGMVYLATCLMHGEGETTRSRRILEDSIARIAQGGPPHALRTTVLLLAQNHVVARRIAPARKAFERLECDFADVPGELHRLMTLQWKNQCELLASPGPTRLRDILRVLRVVRRGFEAIEGWEWARSCDAFPAEILGDRALLTRLFFGTPFPAFRRRLVRSLPESALAERYLWSPGEDSGRSPRVGSVLDPTEELKPGQLPHRILLKLCADFYRPSLIAEIHEEVFPDEIYHPVTSPDRVHKGLRRLRDWLRANHPGLRIEEDRGVYRLACQPGRAVRIQTYRMARPRRDPLISASVAALARRFKDGQFSAKEAALALALSPRTTARRLQKSVKEGGIQTMGRGPGTRYYISVWSCP